MESTTVNTLISHPLLSSVFAVLSWYILSSVLAWYRLRHIPGPRLASFSYAWMIGTSRSAKQCTIFEELAKKYGSLVRIGPNYLLTDDIEFIRKAGAVRGTYNKTDWYNSLRWQPNVEDTFTIHDRIVHDQRKAKIAVAYNVSGREVDLIEPNVDELLLAMIGLLNRKYLAQPGGSTTSGKSAPLVEFGHITSYFTMDVITRAVFGKEFGHIEADADVTGFLGALGGGWPMVSLIAEWPFLRRLFYSKTYLRFFGPKATDNTGPGKLLAAVEKAVEERYKTALESKDRTMLGSWAQHGLSQADCEADGLLAIVAGSETTASVLRITMLSLLSSPAHYAKLKEVVKETITEGKASEPITMEQGKQIPYLRAVVYEGLRMRPAAPASFPKLVPPEGDTIQGTFVPGGTLVGMNLPSIMRFESVFGAEPDLFRPERFLEVDEEKRTEMERTVEMMFGSGRWMCAGKPIAFMELFKTLFELFRHFDFQVANPTNPIDTRSYLVFVDENMWLKVTKAK